MLGLILALWGRKSLSSVDIIKILTSIFFFFFTTREWNRHVFKKNGEEAVSLWCSGNASDKYPRGCEFNPWPRSVGWGSGVAVSCGVG